MNHSNARSEAGPRDRWLALLEQNGVCEPKALFVREVPRGLVQATVGEPAGQLNLEGVPANVLMFNMSPVQGLWQKRDGHCFVSDMLHGEMTLMPAGVRSQWSWRSTCNRLDVVISKEVFGDGGRLDVVDRFAFRDSEVEMICRRLYRELTLDSKADRLYLESLVMEVAVLLFRRHSTASQAATVLPSSGLTRNQARRVLDYIESNLGHELTLSELAAITDLSLHHFARMFKKKLGVAPYRYVLERRLERAKHMLRNDHFSLVEISLSTGFDSQSHFTSTFRRMVGTTPAAFQKSVREHRQ